MLEIKPGGGDTGKPLNARKRLALMHKHMDLRHKRMLDCGCGTGQFVLALLDDGVNIYGIEFEEPKVEQFKRDNPDEAHRVTVGDVQNLAFEDNSFDAVLSNEVLEHVPDDARGLREIFRILRPGGHLFVFSPNRFYPFEAHGVFIGNSDKKVPFYTPFIPYVPMTLGSKVWRYWARNYWPWELRGLVSDAGFEIAHTDYVWQTFENITGKQPRLLSRMKPLLRKVSVVGERVPGLQAIGGVSQFIVAVKPSV